MNKIAGAMTAMVVYPCYLTIMLMLFLNLAYPASWFLFDVAPAILQIPSALPHSHRRPECPAGCSGQWPRSDVVEWLCYWSAFSFGSKNPSVRSVSFKLLVTLLLSIRRRLCAFHHTPSNSVTKSHIPFLSIPGELKESKAYGVWPHFRKISAFGLLPERSFFLLGVSPTLSWLLR